MSRRDRIPPMPSPHRRERGFEMIPGPVATCQWEGCDMPTSKGIRNALVLPQGEKVWRKLSVVPLCDEHLAELNKTRHLKLAFHPDEGGVEHDDPGAA